MKKTVQSLLICAAASLLAVAGSGCSAKAKKAYHQSRADKFFTATNLPSAEIEYLNVLRYDPQNSRAFARLGSIYYDEGRLQRAVFFLGRASALATNDLDLRLKLGFIFSAAGRFSEAYSNAVFILDRRPQDVEAPMLLAESSVQAKDIAATKDRLQTLAQKSDNAGLEVALGNLFLRERDLEKATAAFHRAQTLDAKSPAVNAALGALAWAQNDLKSADADFRAAAEASPVRSSRRMEYARFKIQTGDGPGAQKILDEILQAAPDYVPAMMVRAQLAAGEKKFDESAKLLQQILAADPDNFDAMFFTGDLKAAQGDLAGASADFERMSRVYGQIAQVHFQLARIYFASGDAARGMNSLNRTLDLQPDFPEALLLLAEVQIRNNNPNPAVVALERLLKKQPQLLQAQLLLADTYRLQNRIDAALAIYRSIEKSQPQNLQIPLLEGSAYLQIKDEAAARQAFNRALEISPTNLPALEQVLDLDIAQKQFDAARQRVNAELQKRPGQIELHLLSAKVFLAQGNSREAETTLLNAIKLAPDNQGTYLLLAQLYSNAGENRKALAQLEAAMTHGPKNLSALMLMATIYNADKDYKMAADTYEKILAVDPQFSPALNNLAYLYSENLGRLDRAYDLAQNARQLLPFDPSTADTLGWICYKRGNYSIAAGLLQEAAAKMPDQAEINFHLGMADYMTADETAARTALQHALQLNRTFAGHEEGERALALLAVDPQNADANIRATLEKRLSEKSDDPVALIRLAAVYERAGDSDKAISAYEKFSQANPKNLEVLLTLARLYSAKDIPRAYETAKNAYKIAPYNPDVSHLLGKLAYQSGDFKTSASLLQEAAKSQADNAVLMFDLALARYSLGKISEARSGLQQALQSNLREALATEARRMAELIAIAEDSGGAVAAKNKVAEILKSQPDYVPALHVEALAAEQENRPADAINAYEKILKRFPDFVVAQKKLARLYLSDSSKTDRAYDLAVQARTTFPDDAELGKVLGILMVQKKDYERGISLLKRATMVSNSDAEAFFWLGKAQFENKSRMESKANLQRALNLKLAGQSADDARKMLAEIK